MADILIAFGTTEGHTGEIAARIAALISEAGHRVHTIDTGAPYSLPGSFDAVIVAASVHQGHHQSSVGAFVIEHRERLGSLPSAFVSVSLAAALPDDLGADETKGYIDGFVAETGWRPQATTAVAGALRHERYDYLRTLLLRMLAQQLGSGIVVSEDVVYTDWAGVDAFVLHFLRYAFGADEAVFPAGRIRHSRQPRARRREKSG